MSPSMLKDYLDAEKLLIESYNYQLKQTRVQDNQKLIKYEHNFGERCILAHIISLFT